MDHRRTCRPGEESDSIKIDREFENLIPPLSPSELADLHRSLDEEQGCRDALIVWKGHSTLVDGHNRIRHCREKGYPFPVVEKEFANREEVKAYIINEQLGRRNLSPAAESYLRGKRYLEAKQQGKRTDMQATSGQSDQKTAAERLGEEFKVGEKTIRRDGKFAEAVDTVINYCGPDAKNILLSRQTGLTRGGILRLAKLGASEQKEFIQQLKETGKRPRKSRKAAKRPGRITVPTQPKAMVEALLRQLSPKEILEISRGLAEGIEQQPKGTAGKSGGGRKKKGAGR